MPIRPPARPRRVSIGVTLVGLALGWFGATPPAWAVTALSDGFETGAARGWSASSNVTVGTAFAHDGAYGARLVARDRSGGYLSWQSSRVTQGRRYARISAWVKIPSFTPGQNVSVLSVHNANGFNHFNLWREGSTGKFRYDLFRRNHAHSTMTVRRNHWYFIEAVLDFGGSATHTYRARVRINGVDQPSITSTGQVGTTVRSGWFGGPVTGTSNTRYYDSVSLSVSSSIPRFTR